MMGLQVFRPPACNEQKAFDILENVYGVDKEMISFIPHGIPDAPFKSPGYLIICSVWTIRI
jgi:hypothetical protein